MLAAFHGYFDGTDGRAMSRISVLFGVIGTAALIYSTFTGVENCTATFYPADSQNIYITLLPYLSASLILVPAIPCISDMPSNQILTLAFVTQINFFVAVMGLYESFTPFFQLVLKEYTSQHYAPVLFYATMILSYWMSTYLIRYLSHLEVGVNKEVIYLLPKT